MYVCIFLKIKLLKNSNLNLRCNFDSVYHNDNKGRTNLALLRIGIPAPKSPLSVGVQGP